MDKKYGSLKGYNTAQLVFLLLLVIGFVATVWFLSVYRTFRIEGAGLTMIFFMIIVQICDVVEKEFMISEEG